MSRRPHDMMASAYPPNEGSRCFSKVRSQANNGSREGAIVSTSHVERSSRWLPRGRPTRPVTFLREVSFNDARNLQERRQSDANAARHGMSALRAASAPVGSPSLRLQMVRRSSNVRSRSDWGMIRTLTSRQRMQQEDDGNQFPDSHVLSGLVMTQMSRGFAAVVVIGARARCPASPSSKPETESYGDAGIDHEDHCHDVIAFVEDRAFAARVRRRHYEARNNGPLTVRRPQRAMSREVGLGSFPWAIRASGAS